MISRKRATEQLKRSVSGCHINHPNPILTDSYKDNPFKLCPLCKKELVGEATYTTSKDSRQKEHQLKLGINALFVGKICMICESKFELAKLTENFNKEINLINKFITHLMQTVSQQEIKIQTNQQAIDNLQAQISTLGTPSPPSTELKT